MQVKMLVYQHPFMFVCSIHVYENITEAYKCFRKSFRNSSSMDTSRIHSSLTF